ncbi:fumarylacetoacetate hydrolase family protein [Microbacterium sp. zg.B48]|uniref:fumarylacetoacetate hydrolase family protein n=1 Tax=unclassified Microbacterium TaxID=2609290 RepID=UPI00214A90E4|nr:MULTISPECIES: fumarylacetoacetate hydrolase family protein [unclassified Microbacterium]MCR2762968.1 fumarylacetoacetate hydrolase family protein [Microbacterium sp. zg.B48]MCR2808554.1 fumarylacetoacetate hydrolase family protein [Microbacterium sp. zg.B185]WIM19007.1 fumarylacetoacetate hydrolase family protein [Microbacterium sp. zg-B185]
MRVARWVADGAIGEGFVIDERVVPFPHGLTVADVLTRGVLAAQALVLRADHSAGQRLDDVRLLAPLVPAAIRDFVAFEEHVEGVSAGVEGTSHVAEEWYDAPTFYFTNPHTVLGPGEAVRPPVTERLDFELELAVVVGGVPGSDGSNLTPDAAASHIFGYTIMNDWSARDLQAREMKVRLGPAKGKDFGTSLGPWIVSADELAPFLDEDGFLAVRAEVYVNDALIGADLVSNMGWPFPELVAYAARNSKVVAGDVLGSGTVGNGGCLGELWGRAGALIPPPLREGDEVRMVVEGIGELIGSVGSPVRVPAVSPARPRSRMRSR